MHALNSIPLVALGLAALLLAAPVAATTPSALASAAGPIEEPPWQPRCEATEHMLDSRDEATLQRFVQDQLAPGYVASFADEAALLAHLRGLRTSVAPVDGVGLRLDPSGRAELHIGNERRKSVVALTLEPEAPFRIDRVWLLDSEARRRAPRIAWEELEPLFEAAVEKGFSGSVLAVRDGAVVLDRGFGFADPEGRHPVTPETLFAIGSTPIDFTHGAILKLEELGALSRDDPITEYLDDVPADKRGITLEYLRTGASGLIDFPGIVGVDENLDLSWIDRDEFLRRVLGSELLFEPGTDEKHSHSAWGVLAAIVEIASGQDYESFLREHFFGPAGMTRTGHYPLASTFPPSEVAVGLGGNVWGEVNAPTHWGETSWLVLGSGGMVSTARDLRRWREFLRSGEVLGEAARDAYGLEGEFFAEGGNDRGFINTIGIRGDDLVIVCSNSHVGMDDFTSEICNAAVKVVAGG